MKHIEIESLDSLRSSIDNKNAVLVYFYADQCAPCLSLRPKITQMMEESFPKMDLLFVNSTQRDITGFYGVYESPCLLVFFDQKEYIRLSKYVSVVKLEQTISRFYQLMTE